MGDRHLRDRVRQVLQAGQLPNRGPDNIQGGLGSGAPCTICETAIGPADIELVIQFARSDVRARHLVHLRCYSIYEDERQNLCSLAKLPFVARRRGLA